MPSHQLTDEERRQLVEFAKGWGRIAADEAYGPDGAGLDVDLAGLEVIAVELQQALLSGFCEATTQRQANRLPETLPCPDCGRECPPRPPDQTKAPRTMTLQGGSFELAEPCYFCKRRGFYQARRQVFVADGQEANWTIWRLHFPEFTAVTDFMHAVAYAYGAAQATAGSADEIWPRYLEYATACWQGRTGAVIAELAAWLQEHPLPEKVPLKEIPSTDPRKIVHESFTYLTNNRERMHYPQYRRAGLPVTSSLVESLIKEINWRVKGTEKFWNRPEEPRTSRRTGLPVRGSESVPSDHSGESILQVRAALLCDDNRLEKYIQSRPGNPFVRRRLPPTPAGPAM